MARDAVLTKPAGSLGRLEEIAAWMAAWQGRAKPTMDTPLVAVFAANHGIAERGVSAFPQAVTRQMVANFSAGGAAINQICKAYGLGLKVFELALDQPTPDIVVEDAFDEKSCAATIAYGMEAVAGGIDLLCLGEMGIANTTVAAAIFHALLRRRGGGLGRPRHRRRRCGAEAEGRRGRGGCRADRRGRRAARGAPPSRRARDRGDGRRDRRGADRARAGHRRRLRHDRRRGGAACGRIRARSTIAFLRTARPRPRTRAALKRLGKVPLLDLKMRLGEGTGAALAAGIVKAALAAHNGMATFAEAGVAGKGD